jgi:hypothetical protein
VHPRELALEQYKSLVEDVGNVGVRYATANGFYLSVLTAILGVLAFVGAGKPAGDWGWLVIFLVAAFAVVICWIWRETVLFYGRLFGAKFALLKRLESELGAAVKVYTEEDKLVYWKKKAGAPGGEVRRAGLTAREKWVPVALGLFFFAVAVAALIMLFARPAGFAL